jgi:hypothetical protein
MSRDESPFAMARKTDRFIDGLERVFRDARPDVRAMMALLVAGGAELSAEQRAFFERHGIRVGGVELSDEERVAVERFGEAYVETVLQACAKMCWGEREAGPAGLEQARDSLQMLAAWHGEGLSCDGPQIGYAIGPAFQVVVRNGKPWLVRDTDLEEFNLPELVGRLRKIHRMLETDGRRRNLKRELRKLDERLARLEMTTRLPDDFWERGRGEQTLALLLFGEQLRGVALRPMLRTLLHAEPRLQPALRVALGEARWLIDVRELDERNLGILEPHVAEFTELSGVACTLLTSESSRRQLAAMGDGSIASVVTAGAASD